MRTIFKNLIFLLPMYLVAQDYILVTPLDSNLSETSGLLHLSNTLITHNDSGNTNQLFEINDGDGTINRTVTIANATNVDWEDIAYDSNYIYVADIGNNQGNRTDLKIYRISRNDYFNNTTVVAELINFNYGDQTDFTPSAFSTNFDAEALIHFNNKLYIFTKNWIDATTNIYELPDSPGNHTATLIDSFNSEGLITGAAYNSSNGEVVLVGYDGIGSFLIQLNGYSNGIFSNGSILKTSLNTPLNYSSQTEGIAFINSTTYLISAEELSGDSQGLYSFNTSTLSDSETIKDILCFYPNPANTEIVLNREYCSTQIFSMKGELVLSSTNSKIDISKLSNGIYMVNIRDAEGNFLIKRLLID
ncbi:T9SS type A sorting domain-containing protein [Winogradskyella alexanderae]|uniref:T9SS type A sorting domain-containing protein n=1 Tax=Winogradskyella alexanderae TaxID=2877123 RepID=A0ABS7XT52_9FLAO|nr:T9SS type A sorting domain-containing protein [Winogradskyella alexanderae]MCA0133216.1 T9SS type A sorting domain-containing protein [Winogradskyella alexanderae]